MELEINKNEFMICDILFGKIEEYNDIHINYINEFFCHCYDSLKKHDNNNISKLIDLMDFQKLMKSDDFIMKKTFIIIILNKNDNIKKIIIDQIIKKYPNCNIKKFQMNVSRICTKFLLTFMNFKSFDKKIRKIYKKYVCL
jgi:hypothetical protein